MPNILFTACKMTYKLISSEYYHTIYLSNWSLMFILSFWLINKINHNFRYYMSPRRAIPKKMTFFWDKKLYSRTSIKRPPFKRPPSIKRPFFKVPNYFNVSKLQYSIPLLNGQPLLSSQFLKSRGWPLNRGATVFANGASWSNKHINVLAWGCGLV